MEILLYAMAEAMESSDPRQRARWYSYGSRRDPPDLKVKLELAAILLVRYVQPPLGMSLHIIMLDNVEEFMRTIERHALEDEQMVVQNEDGDWLSKAAPATDEEDDTSPTYL